MGVAFIPGTFPTSKVQSYIVQNFNRLPSSYSREKINNIYFAYRDALRAGAAPWPDPGVRPIVEEKTGYTDVLLWFATVNKLIEAGEMDPKWLIEGSTNTDPLSVIPNTLSKLNPGSWEGIKNLKWISILAILGIGLYFTWPYLMRVRRKAIRNKI